MFFQSDLTDSSPKFTEDELHMQLDHSNYIPILNDVYPPYAFSEPLLHSTVGLPMFSSPFNNDANNQQEIPSDIFSYDYSSVFDHGLLSDHVNSHNRLLSQPQLICGTPTSGFEPISVLSQNQNQNNQWLLPNYMAMGSNSRSNKFSTVISGSYYLGVLHQILSEMASRSLESIQQRTSSTRFVSFDDCFEDDGSFEARAESSYRRLELESKKSQLLGLLQMLDDCYNQCLDKIHSKTSALHAEDELDPQIHSTFALGTISVFYKNLRERISKQILAIRVDRGSTRDKERSFEKCFIQKQWALQQLKRRDQQLWRPQRGLPERSVSVLRAWMFDNFLHPYPKDSEKHLLAIKSGLTRSQVSNWFINARVRLWRPLVEEMSAEHNRRKGCRVIEEETHKNAGENHQNKLSIYKKYKQRSNT